MPKFYPYLMVYKISYKFVFQVRILDNLQDWERLTVADALESVSFEAGDDIGKRKTFKF